MERTQVKSKLVKPKSVKSSSPPPPGVKQLPQPFNRITETEAEEARALCQSKGLDLYEQSTALAVVYTGKDVSKPASLLLKVLRGGGVANFAEIIDKQRTAALKEATDAEKMRKHVRDAHVRAEIPRWMR